MFATQAANAAHMLELVGDFEAADALFRRGTAGAERLGLSQVRAFAQHNWGHLKFLQGDVEAGIALQEQALAFARERGIPFLECATLFYLSKMESARGAHARAIEHARKAVEVSNGALLGLYAKSALSTALFRSGDVDGAIPFAREAIDLLDRLGNLDEQESDVRIGAADVFFAAGLLEEAERQVRVTAARVRAAAANMSRDHWREGVLTRVRSNVRALELSLEIGEAGVSSSLPKPS